MSEAIKAVIEAIRGKDFEAFKNALTLAKREKINAFEHHPFFREASKDLVNFHNIYSTNSHSPFEYLLFTGYELNDLPKWLDAMLEALETERTGGNCGYSPYYTLTVSYKKHQGFFDYEKTRECLKSLSQYADINELFPNGHSILTVISDVNLAKLYLEYGADPNGVNREIVSFGERANTPLAYAIRYSRDIERIKLLLEHGADVNTTIATYKSEEPLIMNRYVSTIPEVLDVLLEYGANIDDLFTTTSEGENILHLTPSEKIPEMIRTVIKHAEKRGVVSRVAELSNGKSKENRTPLYCSVKSIIEGCKSRISPSDLNMREVLEAFSDAWADINAKNGSRKETVLHLLCNSLLTTALRENCKAEPISEWIKDAIRQGANIDALDKSGQTPLIILGRRLYGRRIREDDFFAAATPLLDAGADINIKDTKGRDVFCYLDEETTRRVKDYLEWNRIVDQELETDLFERD